jgi:tripartite-type tricarboxylate transporter receptor subunit TctC
LEILRIALAAVAIAAVVSFPGARALAQDGAAAWPSKPVRWIVPFPPGGPADTVARLLAQKLADRTGQPVIVENRPGAGGNIAYEAAANAAPDGHTLLLAVAGIVSNPHTQAASIDPFTRLASVIVLVRGPLILLASPGFPAQTVPQAIEHIRANRAGVSCGAAGALPSVGCLLLGAHAGTELIMIPYKGNAPAMNALIGGEIDLLFEVVNAAAPQVRAGRARALASTAARRGAAFAPELPVLGEYMADAELSAWQGIMVPQATPREIVLRLNREFRAVLELPDVGRRLVESGLEIAGGTSEEFDRLLRRDFERYGRMLRRVPQAPRPRAGFSPPGIPGTRHRRWRCNRSGRRHRIC